ncbi:hypothetical protein BJ742DRAFT_746199 [Cladochytrium replicatum]|nr:hypothetical protein BJ742DRAFT_746199 [Cladochytrium replicatum]
MRFQKNAPLVATARIALIVMLLFLMTFTASVSAKRGFSGGGTSNNAKDGLSGTEKYVPGDPTDNFPSNSFISSICRGYRTKYIFIGNKMFGCTDIAVYCDCNPLGAPSVPEKSYCTAAENYVFAADGSSYACNDLHGSLIYSAVVTGLSVGAIVGIAVGGVAVVAIVGFFIFRFIRSRKPSAPAKS